MSELKPCPFCGGEADFYVGGSGYIQCTHCLAMIPYEHGLLYHGGRQKAIAAWNRRPAEPNEPLTCEGCVNHDPDAEWPDICAECKRMNRLDNYRRKPESEI